MTTGKPEAAAAVDKLLMMGMKMLETCWAVFKRQAIKLRDWCIWLVDLFEYMMMHGLTNPKCKIIWIYDDARTYKPKMQNYLNIWWCTDLQTLKCKIIFLFQNTQLLSMFQLMLYSIVTGFSPVNRESASWRCHSVPFRAGIRNVWSSRLLRFPLKK